MKELKIIIQFILTIIITIAIIALFCINLLSSTILNKEYILSKAEETDYYSKIYEDVKSNFENYIHQSGFEENVLENIVPKEKIKKDTEIIIDNLYMGTNKKIETQEIRDNLIENIEKTLQNQNLNTTQQNAINTFIDHICNEYTDTLSHFNFEDEVNEYYQKINQYINIAKKLIIITIILDILLLVVINLKSIYKFITSIGVSLTSSGILLIIVNLLVESKVKIQTILILNDTISNIIINILNEILNIIINNGYTFVIIGIILIILPNLTHNIKEGNKEKKNTYEN